MNNFSYGYELELSDIPRSVDIPAHLGYWEGEKVGKYYQGAEIDIVNTVPPFKGVGTDPLCEFCHVGGEVNVCPTTNIKSQLSRVREIFNLFPVVKPAHVNHFHLHVFIPGLTEDVEMLKRFTVYVLKNQQHLVECTYLQDFYVSENISPWGREYLKTDGGRYIDATVDEVLNCETVDDILNLFDRPSYYMDKGVRVNHTSKRTGVNMANLLRGKTVEFRCFRSTVDLREVKSQLLLVERFCEEALKEDGKPVHEILSEYDFKFAKLNYNHELQLGWEKTRASKERGDGIKYSKPQYREPQDASAYYESQMWEIF